MFYKTVSNFTTSSFKCANSMKLSLQKQIKKGGEKETLEGKNLTNLKSLVFTLRRIGKNGIT